MTDSPIPETEPCTCHHCVNAVRPVNDVMRTMIVCPICGNKRCPRANFHDNVCTGSNDTGQPGSAYEDCPYPSRDCECPTHTAHRFLAALNGEGT